MYYQVLQALADGQAYTAQQLMQRLTLTPFALEQAIQDLTERGVTLQHSVINGYQLAETLELLNHAQILAALSPMARQQIGRLEIFAVLDSTNRYLLAQQDTVETGNTVCLAEYQTAGRGRQGRRWISPYASGLCLSLKRRYTTLTHSLNGLNIALAVTIAQTLFHVGATEIGIKWPNDIVWRGQKLAGLLLESRSIAQQCDVVIGIGMNVKMPVLDNTVIRQPWTDLQTVLGQSLSRNTLAALLIERCLHTLIVYPQVGLQAFLPAWHCFDVLTGQAVTLHTSTQLINGVVCGIDETGALLLQVGDQQHRYVCGEVSVRV